MNKPLKKPASAESLSASSLDSKTLGNGKYNNKIEKSEVKTKLKVEFKKGINKTQEVETLMAIQKSIFLNDLTSSHFLEIYRIDLSSRIASIKNEDFGTITNTTFGTTAGDAVKPPVVGGPHFEAFPGIPRSFQNNIKSWEYINIK